MSDRHHRRNLEFLVRLHRQLQLDLPDQLLDELDDAGIDPADIADQESDPDED